MKLGKIISVGLSLLLIGCAGCGQAKGTMIITGKVNLAYYEDGVPSANVQPGDSAINTEVKLYTCKKQESPPLISPWDPRGKLLATTVTDEQGRYQFEVQLKALPRGCDELVVFVDFAFKGYQTVNVAPGTIQVDLIKGGLGVL